MDVLKRFALGLDGTFEAMPKPSSRAPAPPVVVPDDDEPSTSGVPPPPPAASSSSSGVAPQSGVAPMEEMLKSLDPVACFVIKCLDFGLGGKALIECDII